MKRRIISFLLAIGMLPGLVACGKTEKEPEPEMGIKEKLIAAVDQLERSQQLFFEDGFTITGMGVNFSGDVTKKTDNFFWPAIEKMTGVNLDIFWEEKENYITSLSTTLFTGTDARPDILDASDFGVMDLADDGAPSRL